MFVARATAISLPIVPGATELDASPPSPGARVVGPLSALSRHLERVFAVDSADAEPEPVDPLPSPLDDADAQLVALARRDGAGVAAAVYDRFGDEVNALVWRLLGADAEHDDVVHDALVQILSGLPTVRDPQALRRWVISVTINTVRGQIRRRRLHRMLHRPDDGVIDEAVSPTVDHDGRELVHRTARLLNKLSGEQRIAFVLRYVERRSLEETAELCQCSLATVKRRILAANKRLRKLAAADPLLAPRVPPGPRRRQRVVD
ncbi:MAG: sigma-70 family RNA polymerase sigma factor [Myxococcales bacterium FL481]|nr:MAG: sigma-70 family RNA polymerase sigma factor [Myxococcales bacterium FL481]